MRRDHRFRDARGPGAKRVGRWLPLPHGEDGAATTSAAQASAFYDEAKRERKVWTVRDNGGIPSPLNGDGSRSMPFWSLRSRAERVIATVPAYEGFEAVEVSLEAFTGRWLPGLAADGLLVGINWSGSHATGYDLTPAEVLSRIDQG